MGLEGFVLRVMVERVVGFTVNGAEMPPFLCTPENLEELAVGFLRTQGLIDGIDAVAGVEAGADRVSVRLSCPLGEARSLAARAEGLVAMRGGFACTAEEAAAIAGRLAGVKGHYGTHCVGLIAARGDIFREDVGRHNAMDKAIGRAMLDGADFSRCAVAATGRISLEMLVKAASVGVPVIISKKYPSDLSVALAKRIGVSIIGYALSEAPMVFS